MIEHYSVHNDSSSSAKTVDEKELFIIKTAHKGKVKFSVMSLMISQTITKYDYNLKLFIT